MKETDLTGHHALVTGATRGIGLAIAQAMVEGGARVVGTGTGPNPSEGFAALLEGAPDSEYRQLDARTADAEAFVATLPASIDIVVNNAGINSIAEVHDIDLDTYDELHAIDLRAPIALCRALVPRLREHGWGRVANIASIWASITKPGRAMYTASKFGLVGFTKTLAVENARYGILANAVSPGFTLTELTRSTLSESEITELAEVVPAKRFAETEEIARLVCYVCSPLNSYLTGQNLTIDGGFTCV